MSNIVAGFGNVFKKVFIENQYVINDDNTSSQIERVLVDEVEKGKISKGDAKELLKSYIINILERAKEFVKRIENSVRITPGDESKEFKPIEVIYKNEQPTKNPVEKGRDREE